jgi:hypothetical protein
MNTDVLKDLKKAYVEACNCGYTGDFAQYIMKIGIKIEDNEQ